MASPRNRILMRLWFHGVERQEAPVRASRLVNRNVIAGRGRTSMRLEPELWEALREICRREAIGLGDLVRRIEESREAGGRTSAVRVFALAYFRDAATEEGHRLAGHGGAPLSYPSPARVELFRAAG